jgi:sugar phosphate isomerase/epimerase
MKLRIGVSTNCECGVTLRETLENFQSAGIEHAMLSEKCGDLETNLELARGIGINVPYVHVGYRAPFAKSINDLWTVGRANEELIADLTRKLKLCARYGVEVAVMHMSNYPAQKDRASWIIEQGIKSMREVVRVAEEIGIIIALENQSPMDNFYVYTILDAIDSPNLRLCYDCGHHYLLTVEDDILARYGDRLVALHIHDNLMDAVDMETWERDLHYLPFDGKIDFDEVCRRIAQCGYDGVVMLELHREDFGSTEVYEIYEHTSPVQFLIEAKKRGEKLAQMLEKYK